MTFSVKQIDKGGYYMKRFKKLTAGLLGVVMALGVCGFTALAAKTIHVEELSELTSAVKDEETDIEIVLEKDIELESTLVIPSGKNVTIDLGDKTLTGPENPENAFAIQFGEAGDEKECENDGRLVIKNGTIKCNRAVSNYYGEVEFGDDLTVNASDRIMTAFGGKTTVDGAELNSGNNGFALFNSYYAFGDDENNSTDEANASAELIVESGTIKVSNYAITGNCLRSAGTEVTINGGKLIAKDTGTAIYWPMEGKLEVKGGYIEGGTGIEAKMGTINISGDAEIVGTGDYKETSPSGDGNSEQGSALFIGSQKYGNVTTHYKNKSDLTVNIEGGTFRSESGNAIDVYNTEETDQEAEITITDAELEGNLSAIKYYTEEKGTDMNTSVNNGNYSAVKSFTTLNVSGNVAPAAVSSDGDTEFYKDVNDAVEAAGTEEKEVEVAVYGDAVINTDVTLKDNVKLVVAPDTELKANISANGEDKVIVTKTENGNTVYEVANKAGVEESGNYVAKITSGGNTSYFDTLDSAVKTVQNGQTIELLKKCDKEVEVEREVRFTVNANGFDYEIGAGDGYVNTGRGDEYVFITKEDYEDERDSGRHSYSLKEGKTERDDEEEEPVVTPEPEEEEGPFSDVGKDNPNYDAIVEVYEKGWMAGIGDGVFAPNGTLTRGMAVTILWNRAGQPEPANVAPFLDVTSDAWYAKAVAWAYENGITSGYGDTYGPDDFLTTEQFTRMNDIANGRTPEVYVGGAPYATRGWVAGMLVME